MEECVNHTRLADDQETSLTAVSLISQAVCLFGVAGNVLNLTILTRSKLQKSFRILEKGANLCLVSLAVSDLCFCVFAFLTFFLPTSKIYSDSGLMLFYGLYSVTIINVFIMESTLLTVAMSLERYLAICMPLRQDIYLTTRRIKMIIAFTVVFSVVFNIPVLWRYKASLLCASPENEFFLPFNRTSASGSSGEGRRNCTLEDSWLRWDSTPAPKTDLGSAVAASEWGSDARNRSSLLPIKLSPVSPTESLATSAFPSSYMIFTMVFNSTSPLTTTTATFVQIVNTGVSLPHISSPSSISSSSLSQLSSSQQSLSLSPINALLTTTRLLSLFSTSSSRPDTTSYINPRYRLDMVPLGGSTTYDTIYRLAWACLGNWIPLVLLLYFNIGLSLQIIRSRRVRLHLRRSKLSRSSYTLTLTLVAIVLFFLILVAPSELGLQISYWLTSDRHAQAYPYSVTESILNLMQIINFSVNFILYCVLSPHFRTTLRQLLICRQSHKQKQVWSFQCHESYILRQNTYAWRHHTYR